MVGDVSELGCGRVGDKVVVKHSSVALLDLLAIGSMEDSIVDLVQSELVVDAVNVTVPVKGNTLSGLSGLLLEAGIGLVESGDIGYNRHRSVYFGVLRIKFRFVEVISVCHVVTMNGCQMGISKGSKDKTLYLQLTFENNRSIGANENSACTSASSWPCGTLSVDCDVTGNNDSIAAVP